MNNRIYISSGALKTRKFFQIIDLCRKHKFNNLELSSGILWEDGIIDFFIKTNYSNMNFIIHNYFPPSKNPFVLNLASTDSSILEMSLDLCKKAIDLSALIRAPFYSVHSGIAANLEPKMLGNPQIQSSLSHKNYIPYEIAYNIFVDSIIKLNNYAKKNGIPLLVENNIQTFSKRPKENLQIFLMISASEIERLINDVNDANLGILIDVGHLKVNSIVFEFDPIDFISGLSSKIVAFHLSENDGLSDLNLPFSKSSWFMPYLNKLQDSVIIIETYNQSIARINQQINIITSVIESANSH
ncbi:MAG: sugar phosphate isomerase/epimerase family protein [Candidatus Hodarchaeota archaeon]